MPTIGKRMNHQVLTALEKAGLKLNPSKCAFAQDSAMVVRSVLCAATLGLLRVAEALETGTVSAGVNTFAVSFSGAYRDPVVIAVSRSLV